jgi:hypothetical protein
VNTWFFIAETNHPMWKYGQAQDEEDFGDLWCNGAAFIGIRRGTSPLAGTVSAVLICPGKTGQLPG